MNKGTFFNQKLLSTEYLKFPDSRQANSSTAIVCMQQLQDSALTVDADISIRQR